MSEIFATVISDASRCPKTGASGWATWVACNGERRCESGPIPFPTKSIDDAEAYALARGITLAVEDFHAVRLLLQSDSTGALRRFGLRGGRKHSRFQQASEFISAFRRAKWPAPDHMHGVLIMCKHVKGHTRTDDARSAVNRWCDKMAGKAMRDLRDRDNVPDDWDPVDTEDLF